MDHKMRFSEDIVSKYRKYIKNLSFPNCHFEVTIIYYRIQRLLSNVNINTNFENSEILHYFRKGNVNNQ